MGTLENHTSSGPTLQASVWTTKFFPTTRAGSRPPALFPFQRTLVHKRILWNDPCIPAAISVSYGPRLAYVWDTTECRLLYAWANGFLDMESHWGSPKAEAKWRLFSPSIRAVFYKAKGKPPLQINGKPHSGKINYYGNKRIKGHPEFSYQVDGRTITVSVRPGSAAQTVELKYVSSSHLASCITMTRRPHSEILESKSGQLKVLLSPNAAETHLGFKKPNVQSPKRASRQGGLFTQLRLYRMPLAGRGEKPWSDLPRTF